MATPMSTVYPIGPQPRILTFTLLFLEVPARRVSARAAPASGAPKSTMIINITTHSKQHSCKVVSVAFIVVTTQIVVEASSLCCNCS